jgi:homoserine O-acetyltransferase
VYRTPESFAAKFQRTTNEELAILMLKVGCCIMAKIAAFSIGFLQNDESITENDITRNRSSFENTIETVEAEIHIIAINSVCFFTASENKATFEIIQNRIKKVSYQEIVSIHGHDAFDRIQTITQFASYF